MVSKRQRRLAAAPKPPQPAAVAVELLHVNIALFDEAVVLGIDGHLQFTVPADVAGPLVLILEPAEHKWRPIVVPPGTRWRLGPTTEQPRPPLWLPGRPQ